MNAENETTLPTVLTVKEAKDRWGVIRQTLYGLIKTGKIVAYKPGNKYMIDQQSGDAWFLSTKVEPMKKMGRPRKGARR